MKGFYSAHGKFLLSGEYFVLDGALGLALPANYGQHLALFAKPDSPDRLHWKSYTSSGNCWFEAVFAFSEGEVLHTTATSVSDTLLKILGILQDRTPVFSEAIRSGLQISTYLDFPENWGLGSSSTLISCLAQWTGINPFELLDATMGGSGYDIACAQAAGPLLYQKPAFVNIPFRPSFYRRLYFVHLGHKQNSREGIARYREAGQAPQKLIDAISRLSLSLAAAETPQLFDRYLLEHENLISEYLGLTRAQELYFSDFEGTIKSLGAWGGDFVLASSGLPSDQIYRYFEGKGYDTVLTWEQICR